jgi:WD40 repeat protein
MQKIELVLETRSLPLGKVEASRVIDLTELFPPIPFYNPPRSSAEDFVSPTIEFNHDGSRVTIYQSAFNRAGGGVPPFGGWPAATFNSDTGECLGKSLQGAFPLSLVANENRLLLMQKESTDTSEARISGFQTLDLVTGGFSQLGGKGTTSDTNSPGPFSGDPFPIDGVPRNQSRWIQFSPEGDLIAVVQVDRDVNDVGRGYRSVLRLQIIRTSDLSIETTEIPSSFRLQTDELKASSDERPPSIAMAFREDSKQLCVFSDDGLHVFSTPGLKPISSQTINDPNSVKGSHSQDDLPRDWVRPFFANYLDGTHVVCGFTSQPISDGYHRQPQVDDVLNRNEHWKIFEIEAAPFGEAGQIRTDRSMAAILVPSSKDAIVAGKRLARVDLGSIRIEEPSGINGQRGPQMRFPNVRWRIGFNQDRFYQEEGRNHQHFRLQPLTLRTHKIKDITRGFLEQEDRIEPIVSPNSDFDDTGRWFFQGNEIWNVSSGQKKQFSDAAGASIVARSGRWLAIYDTDDPFLNQGRVETSAEKGAVASDGILVWDLENDREHLSVPVYPEARFHHFNFLPFTSYLIMSSSPAQGEGSQRLSILDLDKGTWLSNEPSNRRLGIRFTRQFDPSGRTFLYEYSKQLGEAQQPSNVPPSNEQRFGLARISDGVEIFSGDAQDLVYTVYSPKGSWLAYLASVPSQPDQIKGELSLTSTENGAATRRSLGFAAIGDRDACNVEFSADERNVIVSTDQTRGFMRKAELSKNASAYYQYVVEVWRIADWSRVMTTADTGNALKYFVHPNADTIAIEFDGVSQPGSISDATPQMIDRKSEALKERRWVEFRQLSTGSLIKKYDPATMVASSDDGFHLIIKDHGVDANTSVVDAANGAVVLDMGATVGLIKVSPDGRLLLGHVSQENALRLWNIPGKSYVDLEVPLSLNLIFGFLPNSQQLIAVDQDKSEISLWNTTDGKPAFRFSLGDDHTLDGPIFGLDADYCNLLLRLSPDSKSLAVWMSNVLRVFDLEDGKLRFSIPRAHHAAIVLALDLSPDARWIATGSVDQSVGISNAESGQHVVTLDGYGAAVTGVKFTDDGRHLLTRDATGTLAMWQLDVTDDSGLKPRLNWKIQGDAKTAESMSFAMIASKKQFAYSRSDGSIALARLADGVPERTLATQFSGRPISMNAR